MASFVLLHSPSVGPYAWQPVAERLAALEHHVTVPDLRDVVTAAPPYWRHVVTTASTAVSAMPGDAPLILAAHSNAGLFLPMVAHTSGRRVALLFVDASVPHDRGETPMASPEFLAELRRKAQGDMLPRWSEWWDEKDVAPLFRNDAARSRFLHEQPQLPLAYFEERVPVPDGWRALPAAYLLFGPPYVEFFERAQTDGWPVAHVRGEHLHMLVDPDAVVHAIHDLAERIEWTWAANA
jgi:hypothetical protein